MEMDQDINNCQVLIVGTHKNSSLPLIQNVMMHSLLIVGLFLRAKDSPHSLIRKVAGLHAYIPHITMWTMTVIVNKLYSGVVVLLYWKSSAQATK